MKKNCSHLRQLMQTKVSTFTGSLVLIAASALHLATTPSINNENESLLDDLMASTIQYVEIENPTITVNEFRIKLLKRELEKKNAVE